YATPDQVGYHVVLLLGARYGVVEHPGIEQAVEVGLVLGLAVGLALGGDGAVGLDRDGPEFAGFRIPGVDGAQGVADLLRVDGGHVKDLIERLALATLAIATVED